MAIDIQKGTHGIGFPSKTLSMMGGAHTFNILLTADHDNGTLVGRGNWLDIDKYQEAAVGATNDFAGVIRMVNPDDSTLFYIEATADSDLLFVYNTPKSEYAEKDLQDLALFVNKTGDVVKGYSIRKGDIFMINTTLFNGNPVAGKSLTFKNGKYVVGQ